MEKHLQLSLYDIRRLEIIFSSDKHEWSQQLMDRQAWWVEQRP